MNKCINNENARDARLSLATKPQPAVNSRLTWLGKERDAESGLGDHGVRKYDNQTGRFTAPDPLYEKYINWSPYQYAMNNPVSFVDFTGFSAEELNWLFQTQKSASNTIAELNQNNTSQIEYGALLYTRNGEFKTTGVVTSKLAGRIYLDNEVSSNSIVNGQVVRMHSHPNDKPFSDDDILTASSPRYEYLKYSVVVAKEHVYALEILDRSKAQDISRQTIEDIYSNARSKALKSGATYAEAELTGCKAIQKKYPGIFQFYYSKNAGTLIFKEVK